MNREWIGAPRTGAEYGQRLDARIAAMQKAKDLRNKSKIPRVRAVKKFLKEKARRETPR